MLHGRRPTSIYRWKPLHKPGEERREREMVDNCVLDYRIFCCTRYINDKVKRYADQWLDVEQAENKAVQSR